MSVVRQSSRASAAARAAGVLARRIAVPEPRRLFVRFCVEIFRLSDTIAVEESPFELVFRDGGEFCVVVSPLRELFLVSLGEDRASDVRVSSPESFVFALESALRRHLASRAAASSRS